MSRFFLVRVALLLSALIAIAWFQWSAQRKIKTWAYPIRVAIHPLASGASPDVQPFIDSLSSADFTPISEWIAEKGRRSPLGFSPDVAFFVAPVVTEPPPLLPEDPTWLDAIVYSLSLRWYAWTRLPPADDHDVRMLLMVEDASGMEMRHSLSLPQAQLSIVQGPASRARLGLIRTIMAHELFHLAGAEDKYDADGRAVIPHGLAEPNLEPLFPQRRAEIMGGVIMDSPKGGRIPRGLHEVIVGDQTAREIGWVE